ncbi:gamma-glutamyl-phosphate reductase [Alkalispirochaeta sphaeroplastigenens]|uniref:Gamma-glutamyl phosphate reductase n=1 Tax=Alkalispirochaeta sphaeroplastigenens TaxID=1187066 RepID=A0A2S4K1Q1_9SPIO|nr:glutamate-5-semialdehyde dehydrogenase [Alkalispirochaeta sphaeroplastigenens]POR05689.1 gamma-glutamyl-phosphate reductase [Alkalispirochaeta sphaeroplastigenens]
MSATTVEERARGVRAAARVLAACPGRVREAALEEVARALEAADHQIEEANQIDCARAREASLADPLQRRLSFGPEKRRQALDGVRSVAALPDPVGKILERRELDQGLLLTRRTTPIGVIAMIFESRPDALLQIASLALKSGNGVILKGGSEALESNRVLARIVHDAAVSAGIPSGWLALIETRQDVGELLRLDAWIDLIIPRGSNDFVRFIMDNTRIPVLGHADGICHVYLDRDADPAVAEAVTVDAKTQYEAVCNAAETLLVHQDALSRVFPGVARALQDRGVELRGCPRTRAVLPGIGVASDEDWGAEYLDRILAVRVVDSLGEAVDHINTWGSGHTDAIVTTDGDRARRFIDGVDSASVMWNASTRFADGFRYGLGAEVGVSTTRIHARGPVGVEGLLSSKWILAGAGHIVADYATGLRSFIHRDLSLHEGSCCGDGEGDA